jgi:hypothetical protein
MTGDCGLTTKDWQLATFAAIAAIAAAHPLSLIAANFATYLCAFASSRLCVMTFAFPAAAVPPSAAAAEQQTAAATLPL